MLISFTEADIRRIMPTDFFKKGFTDWLQGNVFELMSDTLENGTYLITAKVRGTQHRIYTVNITVTREHNGTVDFDSHCSCSVGYHCEHAVAALFSAVEKKDQIQSAPVSPLLVKTKTSHSTSTDNPIQFTPRSPAAKTPHSTNHLDSPLTHWLEQITEASVESVNLNAYPAHVKQRILYLLNRETKAGKLYLQVQVVSTRLLKDGLYGKTYPFRSQISDYLRPIDRALLSQLSELKTHHADGNTYYIREIEAVKILQRLLATGRCHWKNKHNQPLKLGQSRTAQPLWQMNTDSSQQFIYQVEPKSDAILPLSPPWYLDNQQGLCGPLETGLPDTLAITLLEAPPLKPTQVETVRYQLAKQLPQLPLPYVFNKISPKSVKPVFHLFLFNQTFPIAQHYRWEFQKDKVEIPMARLSFIYEALCINAFAKIDHILNYFNEPQQELVQIERRLNVEKHAKNRLTTLGFAPLQGHHSSRHLDIPEEHRNDLFLAIDTGDNWDNTLFNFNLYEIPKLQAMGWQIEIDPNYSFNVIHPESIEEWYININDTSDINWFSLELGICVEGQRISLLPLLVKGLRTSQTNGLTTTTVEYDNNLFLLHLEDGRLLPLPQERIQNILEVLVELFDKEPLDQEGHLRLAAMQATQLPEIEAALDPIPLHWMGHHHLLEWGYKLKKLKEISVVPVPTNFQTQLRPYQQDGLNWLQFLREQGLAGILADDMGLGKTVQTLAHILIEKNSGRLCQPCLIIMPTSLIGNWQREIQTFTPSLKVFVLQGIKRWQQFENIEDYDLIFTTYPLLHRDKDLLLKHRFHLLILDEAQNIKNPNAQATKIVRQIQANHRLCLTGTPIENNLNELWSLFHFLIPELLGHYQSFQRLFRIPIEKEGDMSRRTLLSRRIAPFFLRRTKESVVADLPEKNEMVYSVELEGTQRDLYETIRLSMHNKVRQEIANKGITRSHLIILEALLKLRQICCDPRLLKSESSHQYKESAKLQLLMDMLPEMVDEGRHILVFSQFTSMLNLIEKQLKQRKFNYVKLTGKTKNRTAVVESFQNKEVPIFLISLKAGGTGLNLTTADAVIHYDPWWNPALENQATDRAHRLGQDKQVFVYKLLSRGTVEEKIQELQQRKQELADALLNDKVTQNGSFALEDLENLFAPLNDCH